MKRKRKNNKLIVVILVIICLIGIGVIISRELNKKHITIMLDPGHGGPEENQRGAIISTGGREVTLNNQLTLKIAHLLKKEGYTVRFTNDPEDETDYVSLLERSTKANEQMPDLFISIHHDAIKDPEVKGFSLYYSSYRPNIDNSDTYVLYNGIEYNLRNVEIIGSRTHVYYEDGEEIKELISGEDVYKVRDYTPQGVVMESKGFAEILYDELYQLHYVNPLRETKEKTIIDNDFMITRSTNMPSILIEAGFVSNEDEAKGISNEENQLEFAQKVLRAVNKYFGD